MTMHKYPLFPFWKAFFIKEKTQLFPFSYKMFIYFLQRKMKENAIKIFFHTNAENKHTQKPLKCSYDFFSVLYKIVK